ncbi:hypothetical protein [Nostoc commune]|uniref:hypothetical protein n=1 Tax=Nostoc commune TaxID=1178 RepID=UPI0020745122|nr:hypothetical protein [Nostoc commune]
MLLETSPAAEITPVLASYISDVQNSNSQNSVTDDAIALDPFLTVVKKLSAVP